MFAIAIDGPAGSGKSTIEKLLAEKLKISYVDTGSMYRAIAYKAYVSNIDIEDDEAIKELLSKTKLSMDEDKIFIDGKDVTNLIRTEEISALSSKISKNKLVREFLVDFQRDISRKKSVVMEGRDITTVVLPDADYKFFLDASVDERARRRYEQLKEKGDFAELEKVKEELIKRDKADKTRKNSPLKKAEDAILIDTSKQNLEETLNLIIDIIRG
jgi:cytidylate kinase